MLQLGCPSVPPQSPYLRSGFTKDKSRCYHGLECSPPGRCFNFVSFAPSFDVTTLTVHRDQLYSGCTLSTPCLLCSVSLPRLSCRELWLTCCVHLAFVSYDWLISLDKEIQYFWDYRKGRKLTAAALLYGLSRYPAIIGTALQVQTVFPLSDMVSILSHRSTSPF